MKSSLRMIPRWKITALRPYASTLSALASSLSPNLILFPTTARTREIAAMSAVDLNTGVLTDISALEVDGDTFVATRPIYEGKVLEKTVCSGKPVMASIRRRALPETRTMKQARAARSPKCRSQVEREVNRRRLLCL